MSTLVYSSVSTIDRRTRRKQLLRQKILDVSREILLSQGFAALTMRRVAEAIDYSAAAIYLHFQSREQIAQELCFAGKVPLRRLGLAVCRKIVEQHKGTITVASPPGRGAIFTLTFPLTACLAASPAALPDALEPGLSLGLPGGWSPFAERYAEGELSQGESCQ